VEILRFRCGESLTQEVDPSYSLILHNVEEWIEVSFWIEPTFYSRSSRFLLIAFVVASFL
jgi:hypothetical protein